MWHTHYPSWPLLPPTAPSNVETMATASWNQFVTHSLHFVWSVRQSSGAAVGENGAQASGASKFSKWGQAADNHTATSCMTPVRPLAGAKKRETPIDTSQHKTMCCAWKHELRGLQYINNSWEVFKQSCTQKCGWLLHLNCPFNPFDDWLCLTITQIETENVLCILMIRVYFMKVQICENCFSLETAGWLCKTQDPVYTQVINTYRYQWAIIESNQFCWLQFNCHYRSVHFQFRNVNINHICYELNWS